MSALGQDMVVYSAMTVFCVAMYVLMFRKEWKKADERGWEMWKPQLHPLSLALLFVVCVFFVWYERTRGNRYGWGESLLVNLIVSGTLYLGLLALVTPWMRRKIDARYRVLIWLLPNIVNVINIRLSEVHLPLVTIRLPFRPVLLLWPWLGGALIAVSCFMIQHFRYRRLLLQAALPASENAQNVWKSLQERERDPNFVDFKPMDLYVSPNARTPVSIGVFRRSMRVVLPEKKYNEEELELILRHELVHIYRKDAQTKLYLMMWAALMWFDPFIWIAVRRCCEDLEMCCDEFTLMGKTVDERKQYAHILLKEAGDERGFTTCLSSSARSLGRRLQEAVSPKQKRAGWCYVAAALMLVLLGYGACTLAMEPQSLGHAAYDFNVQNTAAARLRWASDDLVQTVETGDLLSDVLGFIATQTEEYHPSVSIKYANAGLEALLEGVSPEELWKALSDERVYRVIGFYNYILGDGADVTFTLPAEAGDIFVHVFGRYVMINAQNARGDIYSTCLYSFARIPDWKALSIQQKPA